MSRLSAIIIAKNEAANIAECLGSVVFADERIVVDGGSTDGTADIAKAGGATVIVNAEWKGFGPQKNLALAHATGDWVLSIDADERVSPALAAEIKTAMVGDADGYEIPRLSSFLGRVMKHSGWYPDYVLRLFRRDRARFSDDLVHERVICAGTIKRLSQPLTHTPVTRIEDAMSRRDRYSTAGAAMLVASGRRVNFLTGYLHGFWTFVRTYILRAGFLDGREGYLLAILNAQGTRDRYMKAWREQRRRG
jgi:glycosyltransferase involved in cell wall biosynthesis